MCAEKENEPDREHRPDRARKRKKRLDTWKAAQTLLAVFRTLLWLVWLLWFHR